MTGRGKGFMGLGRGVKRQRINYLSEDEFSDQPSEVEFSIQQSKDEFSEDEFYEDETSEDEFSIQQSKDEFSDEFVTKNRIPTESVKNLYLDDSTADVYFVFESEGIRVAAHKAMLSVASDVFKKMFYGDLPEKGDVKISDTTAKAFKVFLQFFYLSEVKLLKEDVAEVMGLGHKYNVAKCTQICVDFLKTTLNIDNVCRSLGLAILYDLDDFKQSCEEKIAQNTSAVFKSQGFLGSPRSVLANILKIDTLICREKDIFEACMAWTKHASKQNDLTKQIVKAQLGDIFYDIRFGSMTFDEFGAFSLAYGTIFAPDEYREIVHMISCPGFESKLFNNSPRGLLQQRHRLY
ncbi:BTB/POZ domain-containing protein 3-like [Sitodiplosis mosellana]|uniref:BTB/POZ domain-containing protein 3-like n=1 Tax=Sitodiplosis mosellana TaxID=263140 RepID=UPI0024443BD7|nr:BTB/POZ domain-containing protein 3-like [Sitodiplosis mosellana]